MRKQPIKRALRTACFTLLIAVPSWAHASVTNVNVGSTPNDRTGDPLRNAFIKLNNNDNYLDGSIQATAAELRSATNWLRMVQSSDLTVASNELKVLTDTSVNLGLLAPLHAKLDTNYGPLKIAIIGDSYATASDSPQSSISRRLTWRLMNRRGCAGAGMGNSQFNSRNMLFLSRSFGTAQLSGSVGNGATWFCQYYGVGQNQYVAWTNQSGAGTQSDVAGLFWLGNPQGGSIRLNVRTNGGPWGTLLTVNGASASLQGMHTNLMLDLAGHDVQAVSVTGSNIVLGVEVYNSTSKGVVCYYMSEGGAPMSQYANTPLSAKVPVLQAIAPDLILFHDLGLPQLPLLTADSMREWLDAANCPVIVLGVFPTVTDGPYGYQSTYPQVLEKRAACLTNGWMFLDLWPAASSYYNMKNCGWLSLDDIHLTTKGADALALWVWQKLGLP